MAKNFRDDDEFRGMWNFEGHISPDPNDPEQTAYGDQANAHTMSENPILYGFDDDDRKDR